jgi:hypothetical protein
MAGGRFIFPGQGRNRTNFSWCVERGALQACEAALEKITIQHFHSHLIGVEINLHNKGNLIAEMDRA